MRLGVVGILRLRSTETGNQFGVITHQLQLRSQFSSGSEAAVVDLCRSLNTKKKELQDFVSSSGTGDTGASFMRDKEMNLSHVCNS